MAGERAGPELGSDPLITLLVGIAIGALWMVLAYFGLAFIAVVSERLPRNKS